MKKFLGTVIVIVVCLIILCVCGVYVTKADVGYINSSNGLRVREKPTTRADVVVVLPNRTEVEILYETGDWYKIDNGYIYKEFVTDEKPEEPDMELLGCWHITAYTATGNPCANGNYPTDGYTVACNSLDFGTRIYIEGVGERVVEDRGPSYLGSEWLDLYMGSYSSCVQWGRQYRNVYLMR